ncbi:Glycosyltransferase sdnJ [Naviculisporaceae sp. PSN 640]
MPTQRPSVLFFTISDFGYVNVVLATIYELLKRDEVDIHIASFAPVKPRLESLVQLVKDETGKSSSPGVHFHNLAEFPGFATWAAQSKDRKKADVPHPPGRNGAGRVAILTLKALAIMEPEQYLSLFDWSADLTRKLDPALVVVDPILLPCHDMARTLKRKYAVLHPWSIADGLIPRQGWWAEYWKYPAFSTGFPYPVPWSKIPENISCYLTSKKCQSHPKVQALNQARYAHGIKPDPLGSFTPFAVGVPQITPSLQAVDLPMSNYPPNVLDCGPILVASPPIETSDPELLAWLKRAPTVLVALGTHFEAYAETVREQAIGIRVLLEARPDMQVLWKLKREETTEKSGKENLDSILGSAIQDGRVRIESWLKADPVAILRSGHIACSVHHGGANSYFEATWAGVPQIVLAMWYDTFDYATRVEYLGIGAYGNREKGRNCVVDNENYVAPNLVDGAEFGAALLRIVGKNKGDAGAARIKKRAAELGEVCRKSGGRVQSADIVTGLCFGKAYY